MSLIRPLERVVDVHINSFGVHTNYHAIHQLLTPPNETVIPQASEFVSISIIKPLNESFK
jgi:hypothetical protein